MVAVVQDVKSEPHREFIGIQLPEKYKETFKVHVFSRLAPSLSFIVI
jgi:hypothetical protein